MLILSRKLHVCMPALKQDEKIIISGKNLIS